MELFLSHFEHFENWAKFDPLINADEGEEVIEELEDTHINLMGIHDNEAIFLTQEEQENFLLNQTKVSEEVEDAEQ